MKVLQISKLFPPFWGGIETVVYDICMGLIKDKHKVDVLCFSDDNSSEEVFFDGIRIFRCASFLHLASTYLSLSFVFKWIKIRNDYDVVHIHLPNPIALLAVCLFRTKARVIIHWHSDIIKQKYLKLLFIPFQRYLLDKCHKIIATSPNYASSSKGLSAFSNKIEIVPIGICPERLFVDSEHKNKLMLAYKGKKITFSLGRQVYYKGFKYLVEAFKYLPEEHILLLGGTGYLEDEILEQIKKEKLQHRVIVLGKIPFDELGAYYSFCDLFCLPSIERSEAFGVVQVEAMSFGKPVVSTDIPGSGVSWVNRNNISGYTVPCRNPKLLASKIADIFDNREFNTLEIKKYFTDNFTRDKMNEKIIRIYINSLI